MVTVHSRKTEENLRRYAQIAGGEAELQKGFETWYAKHSRRPTVDEFVQHLVELRGAQGLLRQRFEEMKQFRGS